MLEPRNIFVKLDGDVGDALIRVALREYRHPKEQAALFIAEGLKRLGELQETRALREREPALPA